MLDVGVVIGRFQVPKLTEGHRAVISGALRHARTVILIGLCEEVNDRNPLDFYVRRNMISADYPNTIIMPLPDVPGDDKNWAKSVDQSIRYLFGKEVSVTFYGGRDSFWSAYEPHGAHKNFHHVYQVAAEAWSGTTDREAVKAGFNLDNEDFRRGVIYGVHMALTGAKNVD